MEKRDKMETEKNDIDQKNKIFNDKEKGPLSFFVGSITSFVLFIVLYKLSINSISVC